MELVDSGPQTMMKAQGESVVLGCRYKPSPADTGDLDIEVVYSEPGHNPEGPDVCMSFKYHFKGLEIAFESDFGELVTAAIGPLLVSYSGGTKYVHSENPLSKGMTFSSPDPSSSSGDASLSIPAASPAHSATYQCKVKKSPGVDTRKVSLLVLDSATGELKISNHSQSHAGLYLCEVNNAVGSERCQVHLRASKPPNRAAVIVGTVIGCILLILILLLFIAVLFWKLRGRHRYDKEFSNDIREDVPPPESRPVSRRTTRSSGPSQHHVTYDPLGGTELSWSDDVTSDHPSSKNQVYTPVQYDSKYGYAV
ncbi:hypothetical protein NQD34_009126 [Periophthalmus magnuspinnatus]|nr:hypothetical protein NQD34_009126 [Periophthalmus magnuspinnatus]